MRPFKPWTKTEQRTFDKAHARIHKAFAYRLLAREMYARWGHEVSSETLRRQLQERRLDVRYAIALAAMTDVSVHDLVPWLKPALEQLEEMAA
jgi:hypothetical protein